MGRLFLSSKRVGIPNAMKPRNNIHQHNKYEDSWLLSSTWWDKLSLSLSPGTGWGDEEMERPSPCQETASNPVLGKREVKNGSQVPSPTSQTQNLLSSGQENGCQIREILEIAATVLEVRSSHRSFNCQ